MNAPCDIGGVNRWIHVQMSAPRDIGGVKRWFHVPKDFPYSLQFYRTGDMYLRIAADFKFLTAHFLPLEL